MLSRFIPKDPSRPLNGTFLNHRLVELLRAVVASVNVHMPLSQVSSFIVVRVPLCDPISWYTNETMCCGAPVVHIHKNLRPYLVLAQSGQHIHPSNVIQTTYDQNADAHNAVRRVPETNIASVWAPFGREPRHHEEVDVCQQVEDHSHIPGFELCTLAADSLVAVPEDVHSKSHCN